MVHPKGVADILPLTAAQRGMLYQVAGGSKVNGQYVAVISCTLDGPLDPLRLNAAMQSVLDNRDALRAGYVWEDVKQPVQVIQDDIALPWTELDWSGTSDIETRLSELIQLEQTRQFNLTAPPLMAATLIRVSEASWRLVWTIHHLISDGWSTKALFREVFDRYQNGAPQGPKPPSFKSYLVWLRKQKQLTDPDFWTRYLAGLEETCVLPARLDEVGGQQQHSHAQLLGADLLAQIQQLAAQLRITTNTVLSAAWALTLRRVLQRNDIVFGTTLAGRPPEIPQISDAIGAFVNTLPVRVQVDPSLSVGDFLKNHALDQLEHRKNEYASLAEVQACAPLPPGTPLFDCLFVNEGITLEAMDFGAIELKNLKTVQHSDYPLALLVTPHGQFKAQMYYDPAQMDLAMIEDYLSTYRQVLSGIADKPEQPIKDLFRAPHSHINLRPVKNGENVVQRFLAVAQQKPNASALSDANGSLSYADLSEQARQLAGALKAQGVSKTDIIPVATERGAGAIIAFLGIMMSGAAYVPLDLDYPSRRIAQVFDTVQPKFVVTTQEAAARLPKSAAKPVFLDGSSPAISSDDIELGELAYVMFTSGSQNTPKGVEITHEGLALSTAARDEVHGDPPDAYLLLSSLAFDSSVAGIYWTLATGGHLVIAPKRIEQEPGKLGALIARHRITHTLCLPSLAQALLTIVPSRDLQSLSMLIAAGEPLLPNLVHLCRSLLPQCQLVNEYGPTEGTVWCTSIDTADYKGSGDVPIGRAIPGTWVGVVDIDDCALPPGSVGEIVVAGATVARGYLNDVNQTQERFFQLGADGPRAYRTGDLGIVDEAGCLTFLGRKDTQIKIRGHRIELTEIEAAAQSVAGATRLMVLTQDNAGGPSIILTLECDPDSELCDNVRRHLASALPAPFQPKAIQGVKAFPKLPNGKVDQKKLAARLNHGQIVESSDQPTGELERKIADLFSEVLGRSCNQKDANFFDLGGDSLMTLAVYAKAKDAGIAFEPTDLFTFPTISQLAARVRDLKKTSQERLKNKTVQLSNPDGSETPVVLVHCPMAFYREVVQALGPDHPVALLPSHRLPGRTVPFGKTMEELGEEAISSFIDEIPDRPVVLCGFSAGCALTLEIVRQLGQNRVAGLIILDPPYKMIGSEPELQPLFFRTYKTWRYQFRALKHRLSARRKIPIMKAALAANNDREQQMDAVSLAYDQAINAFRVPRVDVPTHVFLTPGNPSLRPGDVLDTHLQRKQLFHLSMPHREVVREAKARQKILSSIVALAEPETGR